MPVVAPIASFETNSSKRGKAGRPAQPGERYPSGKLKPADKREGGPAPAEIKKAFDAALKKIGREPLLGTSLGLLFMTGKIAAPELAAGIAFARLQGRYDRAMGMPGRFTMSPDYGTARAISSREPMSEEAVAAVKDRHAKTLGFVAGATQGSVMVAAGSGGMKRLDGEAARSAHRFDAQRTLSVLERVCVEDLACEGYELDRLRAALRLLASWFGVATHGAC